MKYPQPNQPVSHDDQISEASWPQPAMSRLRQLSFASAKHHGIQEYELRKDRRQALIVRARHVAIKAGFESGYKVSDLARYFNKDHTTILYALRVITESARAMRVVDQLIGLDVPVDLSKSLGEVFNACM